MSDEPDQQESAPSGETSSQPESTPSASDSHQVALNAARDAEQAVSDSAYSPGLGQRN
ncbi:MAG TPA: hypothetical protein VGJ21_12340 [Terracidiphilus sp.]|jgi:hypothetical protein